ncbi:MAG: RsiV family protein [Bacteroidales bacterium]
MAIFRQLFFYCAVTCIFLQACGPGYSPLEFETLTLQRNSSEMDGDTLASLSLHFSLPVVKGEMPLRDSLLAFYKSFYADSLTHPLDISLDSVSRSLITDYLSLKQNDTTGTSYRYWNYSFGGRIVFENRKVITAEASVVASEGLMQATDLYSLSVFNKSTGRKIDYQQLVSDEPMLLEIAERAFRSEHGLGRTDPFSDAGFFFRQNRFFLPRNFTFGENAILFLYNRFEIAPRGRGQVVLKLPIDKVKNCLNLDLVR